MRLWDNFLIWLPNSRQDTKNMQTSHRHYFPFTFNFYWDGSRSFSGDLALSTRLRVGVTAVKCCFIRAEEFAEKISGFVRIPWNWCFDYSLNSRLKIFTIYSFVLITFYTKGLWTYLYLDLLVARRATYVVDGRFFGHFFGRWRGAVRIHVSHVQLTCGN